MNTYNKYFVSNTRANGDTYYYLNDEAPGELRELIQNIHFKQFELAFPDDWIYEQIMFAFEELSDNNLDDLNIEADVYTHDLLKWLQNPFALAECDEARKECGLRNADILDQITYGQWYAKRKIYDSVNEFLEYQERHADK